MKVLVTGGFGWTARMIIEALHINNFEIVVFDIATEIPAYLNKVTKNIIIGSVSSKEDVQKAMAGCDYVIHLAVAVGENDYKQPDQPFDVNVKGTYNVLEVARELKVKKTIVMSEAPVHVSLKDNQLFSHTDWKSSTGADHLYDLTKRLQECIAKDFSETYGMNIIVLRPGHIVDGKENKDPLGNSLEELSYCNGGWVCRYDVAKACISALKMRNTTSYYTFHLIGSYQAKKQFDIDRTEQALNMKFACTFNDY